MTGSTRFRDFFVAFASVAAVAGVCFPLADFIGYRSVALLLLLVVSVLAMRLSLWPVLVAAAMSALVWNFFFIPPIFTFHIGIGEDVLLLAMYFIVALLNGIFNHRLRQLEQIARQKEEKEAAIRLYNVLFSSLSHELRTPIATIVGAADALQENAAQLKPAQRNELIAAISTTSLRLHQQVENLLNTSRIESGSIRPKADWNDVSELIYNVLGKMKKQLANHSLEATIPEDLPLVQLDYGLTEQVLFNLLNNAALHTPPGSKIWLNAQIASEHRGHFGEQSLPEDLGIVTDSVTHTLVIEVSDNGPGFPPDEIQEVFGKFYRLKNTQSGGTGLGLFIVKGFVEAQGGTVSVSNRANGGARFIIELPVKAVKSNSISP